MCGAKIRTRSKKSYESLKQELIHICRRIDKTCSYKLQPAFYSYTVRICHHSTKSLSSLISAKKDKNCKFQLSETD